MLVGTAMRGARTRPSDDRGQRALHPRDRDHDPGLLERGQVLEQPVQTGDAHVAYLLDLAVHEARGDGRFLGHRQVRRPGAHHHDAGG